MYFTKHICKKFLIDLKQTEMLTHHNNKRTLLQIINQDSLSLKDERLKTELENKIQNYYEIQFEGTRIRSKIHKFDNETFSKSFFNIEINKARQKTITQLMNENEKLVSDKDKILDVTHAFYKKLWGEKDQNISEKLQNDYATIMKESAISIDEVKELKNFVFEKEIKIALNQLNKESSPGSNGLTTEFYKTFFYLIKTDMVEIYNDYFLQKEMSKTMKQVIVKLIFKKRKKR